MKIELMNDSHLEEILKIDQMAFEREEPRTLLNLQGLRIGDPHGCVVLLDGKKMMGYSFTKTMGEEGYLGPVGIKPSIHGQGWGQKLIQHSLDYLKGRCKVIGLEVRPEAGNNLGLYHKLGFQSTFPSLIMEVPEKIEIQPEMSEGDNEDNLIEDHLIVDNYDNRISDFKVELSSEMSENRIKTFLDKIEKWTRQELKGVSYRSDLELAHAGGGQIIIISHEEEPLGFLASYSQVFLHLWGAIKPTTYQKDVLMVGLHLFREITPQGEVLLEVNTRYHKLTDLFVDEGFKIRKSVNRMLLKGFEGNYLNRSSDFVMRAWHA